MANILVIDDDEQLRDLVVTLLSAAGHVVTTAGNGQEGLKQFRAEPADLVITDIVMPDQEGLETIMKLRAEYPGLGIIAMSGGASHSATWLTIAAKLGAGRTLAKPFTIAELTGAVTAVLTTRPPPPRKTP